jgi:hypothetical protein
MSKNDIEETLGGVFDSFSNLVGNESVELCPTDSTDISVGKAIDDHILGLLSLPELTPQQVSLLSALLSGRD